MSEQIGAAREVRLEYSITAGSEPCGQLLVLPPIAINY